MLLFFRMHWLQAERIKEDEDITEVLNRYVQKLQASLAIMNSADDDY